MLRFNYFLNGRICRRDKFEIQIITFNFNLSIGIQQAVSNILNQHLILHIDDIIIIYHFI